MKPEYMFSDHVNGLSFAETERLSLLAEELGEIQQMIGKILRHGYESRWPIDTGKTNRERLELELGDFFVVYAMMTDFKDINPVNVYNRKREKLQSIKKWLHYQVFGGEQDV